jgi:hypothetical protein
MKPPSLATSSAGRDARRAVKDATPRLQCREPTSRIAPAALAHVCIFCTYVLNCQASRFADSFAVAVLPACWPPRSSVHGYVKGA